MELNINNKKIKLNLKISKNRKRTVSLKVVSQNTINVTAPYYMNEQKAIQFLNKNWRWVFKNIDNYREPKNRLDTESQKESRILFMGNYYPILYDGTFGCDFYKNAFHTNTRNTKKIKSLITLWYKTIAREIIPKKVKSTATRFGLKYGNIKIGSAKTAMGTCSPTDDLNFSWRLVMMPEFVIDYVVVHELAHTRHHNHSKRFWNFVREMMPRYKKAENWIKKHIPEIHEI